MAHAFGRQNATQARDDVVTGSLRQFVDEQNARLGKGWGRHAFDYPVPTVA
jgi:hypothetical protein